MKIFLVLFSLLTFFHNLTFSQNGVWVTAQKMPLYKNNKTHVASKEEAIKDIRATLEEKKIKLTENTEVNITVDTSGKVKDIKFSAKSNDHSELEMLRKEIYHMHGWIPGEQDSHKVAVRFTLYITKLDSQLNEGQKEIKSLDAEEKFFELKIDYISLFNVSKTIIAGTLLSGTLNVGDKGIVIVNGQPKEIIILSINNGNDKSISGQVQTTLELSGVGPREITVNSIIKSK